MDKHLEINNREDVLTIKTGINYYRSITLLLFIFCASLFIILIVFNRNIIEIVNLILSVAFLLLTIFMDKIVHILKLPTYYLFVSKDEIIYKKGKKRFVYKTNETSYKFHPFIEDFELPLLVIVSKDQEHSISITKKQFQLMDKFLRDIEQ